MKKPSILVIAFMVSVFSSAALAAENTQRLCKDADLTGAFKMADFRETPPSDELAWYKEYHNQYLVFGPARTYGFVAARHAVTKTDELQKAVALSGAEGSRMLERKYTLDPSGILDLYVDGKLDYSYRCMVVIQASGGDRVGDLMLTGYSKKKTELYKLFRPWK